MKSASCDSLVLYDKLWVTLRSSYRQVPYATFREVKKLGAAGLYKGHCKYDMASACMGCLGVGVIGRQVIALMLAKLGVWKVDDVE